MAQQCPAHDLADAYDGSEAQIFYETACASYCLDSISLQLQAELDTTRNQLSDSNAEATAATQQLRSVEAARQVSELGHQTQAERARDLNQRFEQLSETLEAERGVWADEKLDLKV